MIEKSLLLRKSASFTLFSNLNAFSKVFFLLNLLLKTTKRWNPADLGYFNPYLDKAYNKNKIVLISRDVYYNNMMLLV